jgi:UDP-N-acetylmuramoyl-L-alanyl-D-glutamate--2,6-diaminopimelate ligase
VRAGQAFAVLVDYAHTDDALKNVLSTLRPLCKGKLIALFGCGGDRDKTKRPRMARVCWEMADRIFVTSDNPRTEDPLRIIEDILSGFENPNDPRITVQPDRRAAIEAAIQAAGPDDIVLLAGKGHEDYQILGTTKIHFDDREIARQTLEKHSSPR